MNKLGRNQLSSAYIDLLIQITGKSKGALRQWLKRRLVKAWDSEAVAQLTIEYLRSKKKDVAIRSKEV
jgi:hypothetical protein